MMELDSDSRTPLIHAILGEKIEIIISVLYYYRRFDKKLLRQLIFHKDKYGYTASYYASLAHNQKICMVLNYFEPLVSFQQRGSVSPASVYTVSMMDLIEYLIQSSCNGVVVVCHFLIFRIKSIFNYFTSKQSNQSTASNKNNTFDECNKQGSSSNSQSSSSSSSSSLQPSSFNNYNLADRFPYILTLLSVSFGFGFTVYFLFALCTNVQTHIGKSNITDNSNNTGYWGIGFIYFISFVSQLITWICMYVILYSDPGYVRPHPSNGSSCDTHDLGWQKYSNYAISSSVNNNVNEDYINDSSNNNSNTILFNRHHSSSEDVESGDSYNNDQVSSNPTFSSSSNKSSYSSYEFGLRRIVEESKHKHVGSTENQLDAHTNSFGSEELCCHYCRIFRPYRAGHSSVTGKCVLLYDHFCVMLNADIGRDNYWLFILFCLVMATITMPTFVYLSILHVKSSYNYYNFTSQIISIVVETGMVHTPYNNFFSSFFLPTSPFILYKVLKFLLVWTMLIWFAIVFTLSSHTYFMCRGLTSREVSMMQRYDNLSYLRNQRNAFSRRSCIENALERLFPVTSIRCECYSWDEIVQMKRSTQADYTVGRVLSRIHINIIKWWKNIRFNQKQLQEQSVSNNKYSNTFRIFCLRAIQSCLRRFMKSHSSNV